MTVVADPLAAIAEVTPAFSDKKAIEIVRDVYGLNVSVKSLVSERDQNFQLRTPSGEQFVLKIASAAEDPAVTEFQIEALLHIGRYVEAHGTPISAPTILQTLAGETHVVLNADDQTHVVRVVSYIAGVPVGNRTPSPQLSRNQGAYLANLGRALAAFKHVGCHQALLWDIQQASQLRDLAKHIPREAVHADVIAALNDFERFAWPKFDSLRRQVVHSDFNPDNVLVDSAFSDEIVGVIDFGDMLEAPLIADVAIAASYARPDDGDPLTLIAEFVAGYASVTLLLQDEIEILFELIKARLCASIVLLYWRASFRDSDDPYLEKIIAGESFSETFLSRLISIPRDHATQVFRQVHASVSTG
jgi:hydroxylysine kinase